MDGVTNLSNKVFLTTLPGFRNEGSKERLKYHVNNNVYSGGQWFKSN